MKKLYLIIFALFALLFVILFFSRLMIAIVPIIGAIIVCFASKNSIRLIKTALTPINAIKEGTAKLRGTFTAPETFVTPYFKQKCIGYHYKKADVTYDCESGTEHESNATIEEEFRSCTIFRP